MRIKNTVIGGIVGCSLLVAGALVFAVPRLQHNTAASTTPIDLLGSGWDYVPGVEPRSDGLHVSYLGRDIVARDGTPGQSNPAVNVYGTYLDAKGDFAISAQMKDIKGTAAMQFYSETPVVQDEFRVIPPGIELQINGSKLTVNSWNKYANQDLYKQNPATSKSYTFQSRVANDIGLERRGDEISVILNGIRVAALPSTSLAADKIWFGLSAPNTGDHWTLAKLVSEPTDNGSVSVVHTNNTEPYAHVADGLQVLASKKRPGFLVGAAMATTPTISDYNYASLALGGNFGSVTTENALKWQFIHPQPDVYDYREADALVDMTRKNGLAVHGHTLVFGQANPEWVQQLPADRAKQAMTDHIKQTVGHFRGRVASWDVVNEPFAEDVTSGSPLQGNVWFKAMGSDYIETAFREAHTADPNAKLYINDYDIEDDGDRWDALLSLVTKLKNQGVPIDGVGFQAHVYDEDDKIDPAALRRHIQKLASLGLNSRISEMDVYSDGGAALQARQYADIFAVCISEPTCVSWTTWGVTDRYNLYQDDANKLAQGQDFLWNKDYQPTMAVAEIKKILAPAKP